jgi:hypothetical protein
MYSNQFPSPFSPEQEAKMLASMFERCPGRIVRFGVSVPPRFYWAHETYVRTAPISLAALGPCPETEAEALKAAPLRSVLPVGFAAEVTK